MQKSLLFKTLAVFGLMLLIGIPLIMINATIAERMQFRDEAVRSVAADSVRAQSLLGPILVLPYTEEYEELVPAAVGVPVVGVVVMPPTLPTRGLQVKPGGIIRACAPPPTARSRPTAPPVMCACCGSPTRRSNRSAPM